MSKKKINVARNEERRVKIKKINFARNGEREE